jgi:cobalt-zinc-cadmium efflux system membrane fusion protein
MKISVPLNVIIVSILLSACTEQEPAQLENELPGRISLTINQIEKNQLKVEPMKEHTFSEAIHVSGLVDVPPENRVIINTFSEGYIKQVSLLVGNEVKRGELLVILENPEYVTLQQNYLEISEQITFLKADYDRQKALFDDNITSEKNYLKAQSDYNKAMATYHGLRSRLKVLGLNPDQIKPESITSSIKIHSPINGIVTNVFVSLGSYVSPSDKIMEIINPDHKHLELIVFEKDIMALKKDQIIRFRASESSNQWYDASVALIGQSIDTDSRTVRVHGHMAEEIESQFTVGMFIEGEIVLEQHTLPALPENAIVDTGGKSYVLMLEEKEGDLWFFKKREVIKGYSEGGFTSVKGIEEFPENATFLINGVFSLIYSD